MTQETTNTTPEAPKKSNKKKIAIISFIVLAIGFATFDRCNTHLVCGGTDSNATDSTTAVTTPVDTTVKTSIATVDSTKKDTTKSK